MCAEAPDDTGNQMMAQVAGDQLAFNKQQWAEMQPYVKEYLTRQNTLADESAAMSRTQREISDWNHSRYKDTFAPIEDSMAAEAAAAGGEADQEQQAQRAQSDTQRGLANARATRERQMMSMGVNPNSGKFAATANADSIMAGAAEAAAMTKVREAAKQLGWAKKADVANMGRGIASQQATAAGLQLSGIGTATQAGGAGISAANQTAGVMNQGMSSAGNMYGQMQQNANQSAQIAGNSPFAQFAGAAVGRWAASSEELKEDKEPVSGDKVVKKMRGLRTDKWKYKDGEGDGGRHVGPYAEEVQAAFGDEAAPGGKAVDLVTLNGLNMAAIKAIDKRLAKLEGTGLRRKER